MGKTEVTQGQWKKVMGNNPSYFKGKGDNYPVEQVGWNDGKRFAEKLTAIKNGTFTFRLATEAEWEYACRSGGKPEKYAGGSDLDKMSWYFRNSNRSTHAVATKAPNGLGLFDMSGNVFEWCEDSYHPANYSSHQRNNPMYADERGYQVLRGGSWNRVERSSRCATRGRVIATNLSRSIGFRVVRKK
jgi:formylglycine-generating enzyme required for sulfatase activity